MQCRGILSKNGVWNLHTCTCRVFDSIQTQWRVNNSKFMEQNPLNVFLWFFIQQQNLFHPDIWRVYTNKTFKKSIPFLILFHFSICMYTIIAYDRMVSSPIYIFFRLLFFHLVIKSHIEKGQHKQDLLSSLDIYSQ